MIQINRLLLTAMVTAVGVLMTVAPAIAHDPDFTDEFNRDGCTFSSTGSNRFFPLWPGYEIQLEGEEEDEGETIEISKTVTILADTEMVDGVLTRVVEERESEDGELVEVSRNFFVMCRETGDVWYFGEDVTDFDDGVPSPGDDAWRAGVDGASAGVIMPGSPMIGARHFQEMAPGVALDQGEVVSLDESLDVPFGSFDDVLMVHETSGLEPDESGKWYAPGVGLIKDDEIELTEVVLPPCLPDGTTHCLQDGRFRVEAEWALPNGDEGDGRAILASADSGEFYFFNTNNTELLVKVLNGCNNETNAFWVFAAGLTNVEVTLTVTDTESGQVREYENPQGNDFEPILDTSAFATCP